MSDETLLSGQATTESGAQQTDVNNAAPVQDAAPAPAADAAPAQDTAQQPQAEKPADDSKPQGAPDSYEFAMPDGFELNAEVGDQFKGFAKELNLPQDKAQAVVDMGVKLVEQAQAKQMEAWQQQLSTWRQEVETDKEIGGKALPENLGFAAKAIDTFGPELRQVFEETGLGNHPALVKAFIRIGKAISEDRLVGGQQAPSQSADPAKKLFPNMN